MGPSKLTEEWQHRRNMRAEFEQEALEILNRSKAAAESVDDLLSMTTTFWQRQNSAPPVPVQEHRFASREEACIAAAAARERAAERLASKGKGKGKSGSKGNGHSGKGIGLSDSDSDSD